MKKPITIEMDLNFKGIVSWYLAIKWLHDALLEDCLDKVYRSGFSGNFVLTCTAGEFAVGVHNSTTGNTNERKQLPRM